MRTNELTTEPRIIEAGIRYRTLLDRGEPVNVRAFVQACDTDIQKELQEYLELCLVMEEPRADHPHDGGAGAGRPCRSRSGDHPR